MLETTVETGSRVGGVGREGRYTSRLGSRGLGERDVNDRRRGGGRGPDGERRRKDLGGDPQDNCFPKGGKEYKIPSRHV